MLAVRLLSVERKGREASQTIDTRGDGFNVSRAVLISDDLDAASVAAQVIELKPFGDRSDKQFVGEPMGEDVFAADPQRAVPVRADVSGPPPSSRGSLNIGPPPDRWIDSSELRTLFGVDVADPLPSVVVHSAPAPRTARDAAILDATLSHVGTSTAGHGPGRLHVAGSLSTFHCISHHYRRTFA